MSDTRPVVDKITRKDGLAGQVAYTATVHYPGSPLYYGVRRQFRARNCRKGAVMNAITDFRIGQRVESHPATDAWIFGDRYGTVERVGRSFVHVRMDRSGKLRKFRPELVSHVAE